MRPEDERPEDERFESGEPSSADEIADSDAGEHSSPPPPATYAGRRRAENAPEDRVEPEGDPEPDPDPGEGVSGPTGEEGEPEPPTAEEDLRAGFTEEFDEIERDLDAELSGLDEIDEDELLDDADGEPGPPGPDEEEPSPAAERGADERDEPFEAAQETVPAQGVEGDQDAATGQVEDAGPVAAGDEADNGPQGAADAGDEDAASADATEGAEATDAPDPGATVEAETLALADRAEAEEEALAAVRARAAGTPLAAGTSPEGGGSGDEADDTDGDAEPAVTQGDAAAAPVPVAAAAGGDESPPRAKRLWARFLAASLVIVISVAAATSISLLAYLTDIAKGLSDNDTLANLREQLTEADGGDPQTILIIGSDKRLNTKGDPGRSDTTILLRVDPDKHAIALLSIPRDLRVNIPGVGVDKFNAAYSAGGPEKTLRVVEQLTGLQVNHVVNINFTGFADAVDAIGCVYVDVDRRYYIPPETGTAEINIEAGYQRLCGLKALQYVRFRHEDNDLVRSARQQDFLREARQKLPPGVLIRDRNKLLDIFTEYTTSDIGEAVPLLELLKTFLAVQSAPVREVHFPAQLGTTYVTASDDAIKKAVRQFLDAKGTPGDRPAGESPPADNGGSNGGGKPDKGGGGKPDKGGAEKPDKPKPDGGGGGSDGEHFEGPTMDDATEQGLTYAHQASVKKKKDGDPMIDFPIYYPTRLVPGSFISNDSRAFVIDGPEKEVYHGYKMVVDVPGDAFGHGLLDEFYGVSGTDWIDAPILQNPSETRTIDGRQYLLFYDGDRLRTVGFKTGKGAYWVNNTLLQSLDEGQMLSIATSMREYEGK